MKTGRTLVDLATELERQSGAKRDLLVDTPVISLRPENDRITLNIDMGAGADGIVETEVMDIGDLAHRQIGVHTAIPAKC